MVDRGASVIPFDLLNYIQDFFYVLGVINEQKFCQDWRLAAIYNVWQDVKPK